MIKINFCRLRKKPNIDIFELLLQVNEISQPARRYESNAAQPAPAQRGITNHIHLQAICKAC